LPLLSLDSSCCILPRQRSVACSLYLSVLRPHLSPAPYHRSASSSGLQYLNFKLNDVSVVDETRFPHMISIKSCFIRGSVVRYVQLPPGPQHTLLSHSKLFAPYPPPFRFDPSPSYPCPLRELTSFQLPTPSPCRLCPIPATTACLTRALRPRASLHSHKTRVFHVQVNWTRMCCKTQRAQRLPRSRPASDGVKKAANACRLVLFACE
jgi:hypothetical protein